MLDSIREIFDILGISFESIDFKLEEFTQEVELYKAIKCKKCPIVGVDRYVMVATGFKPWSGIIQLKNSYADDPNIPGKVR